MVSRRKGRRRGVCYRELSPSHEAHLCADRNIGPVAQSVEHLTFNQRVAGSSPARLTIPVIVHSGHRVNPLQAARPKGIQYPSQRSAPRAH